MQSLFSQSVTSEIPGLVQIASSAGIGLGVGVIANTIPSAPRQKNDLLTPLGSFAFAALLFKGNSMFRIVNGSIAAVTCYLVNRELGV
jgi:hypothetical protein